MRRVVYEHYAGSLEAGSLKDARAAYEAFDFVEAVRILRPIAEQGNAEAQLFLGGLYLTGKSRRHRYSHTVVSVPKDYAEAARLYRLAAGQGNAVAPYNLGVMYFNGEGVPQDFVLAHMWFNLAAAQGDTYGPTWRDELAKMMTPAEISEAQQLAREWVDAHP